MKYIIAILLVCTATFADSRTLMSSPIIGNTIMANNPAEECLALNVYYEARGQSVIGAMAVAEVTMNRVKSKKFRNHVCQVVYRAWAFSWTSDRSLHRVTPNLDSVVDARAWTRSLLIARRYIDGVNSNITRGALFFHARYVSPYWAKCFTQTIVIDDHIFYKNNLQRRSC